MDRDFRSPIIIIEIDSRWSVTVPGTHLARKWHAAGAQKVPSHADHVQCGLVTTLLMCVYGLFGVGTSQWMATVGNGNASLLRLGWLCEMVIDTGARAV
jgi:hypothetical protein